MKNKYYSKSDFKAFKKIINKKLKNVKNEKEILDGLVKDQKKYIADKDSDIAGNSKFMRQKAMLKKMQRRLKQKIKGLNSALKRIDKGTYGICKDTGKKISRKRLMAMPTATRIILKKKSV